MTSLNRLRLECVLLLLGLLATSSAAAQNLGFSLDRYEPAERGSDWFAGESLDFRGSARPAIGLTADFAYKPLVIYDKSGDEAVVLVKDQLFAHVGASFVLAERVRFGLNVPVALWQAGSSGTLDGVAFSPSHKTNLGDLRLGADLRLLGEYGDAATLAIGLQAHLPSGSRDAYTGDGKVRLTPRLMLAGDIAIFAYSAAAGFNYRAQDSGLGSVPTGNELLFTATAGLRLADKKLLVGPEVFGSTVVQDKAAFKKATTPFEILFGAHYRVPDWMFGLGVGPGLTRGLGSPALRVLASIDWQPDIEKPAPPPPPEPEPAPPPPKEEPAPPPPPPDRDGDGVIDAEDRCPDTPGVRSSDPDENGCPPDRDGDGVIDADDACPDVFGELSPDPKKNGCPKARVEQGQIKILERIEFKTGSAQILEVSEPILEAVRKILDEHSEITKLSIEGHTDNVGKAAYNQTLSQKRSESVRQWLIKHGISASRLTAKGFGMSQPIEDNATDEGREHNRRVEFHIREQSGSAASGNGTRIEE